MIDVLILAAALAQSAQKPASAPANRAVQIYAESVLPNGEKRIGGVFRVADPSKSSGPMYFYANPTTCEGMGSSVAPAGAAYGWEVEVVPAANGPLVRWKRLPGAAGILGQLGATRGLTARNASPSLTLDTMDGSARLSQRRKIQALKAINLTSMDLEPELRDHTRLVNARAGVGEIERELQQLRVKGRGAMHPDVKRAESVLAQLRSKYLDEKATVLKALIQQYTDGTAPLPAVNGCNALSYSLVADYSGGSSRAELIEAELWFVHKAPNADGTEWTTHSQRQVLRLKQNGRGEFYFDDLELQTRWLDQDLKLTVEVFGSLLIGTPDDGEIPLTLNLTRRYLTKQFLIGSWPKSGSTQLPTSVAIGEVVSFVLPPLQDDAGVFLGHRFQVRLRLKPLSP